VIASWINSCPLDGRCVECGLDFRWSDLLRPDALPRWYVERADGRYFSGTRTLLRSLRPWRFWTSIKMTMPVSARLWTYPIRLLAILTVLSVLATLPRTIVSLPPRMPKDPVADIAAIAGSLLMPFLHVPTDEVMDDMVPEWSLGAPGAPMPWDGVWRSENRGARTGAHRPSELWAATWGGVPTLCEFTLVACAGSAATFVVLPIVRRRAKVRWEHVRRATVCGLVIVVIMVVTKWVWDGTAIAGEFQEPYPWAYRYPSAPTPWILLMLPVLLFIWWWNASRFYLRLERPAAVAASVTVVGTLAAMFVLVMVHSTVVINLLRAV